MFRKFYNSKPILWMAITFVAVFISVTILSVWWNYLLVQNHRVLRQISQAAQNPANAKYPLALMMILGLLCFVVILLGLTYMFLKMIQTLKLNLAQSQFISAVTHELRSPVASVKLLLETIRNPQTPPDVRKKFEDKMAKELRRLEELVDQVLDTTRLENFFSVAKKQSVYLSDVLNENLSTHEEIYRQKSATLKFKHFDSNLKVMIDRRLFRTAISNIFDNALKYAPENKPLEVTLSVKDNGKNCLIEIADNGIGMKKDEQKKVFKRFYRSENTISKKGTGLGLYFARLAIVAQGGKIQAVSDGPEQGSKFLISLPKGV
ncbi:MAG: sensor histidine kinase [Bacteriovoracia bacterium]